MSARSVVAGRAVAAVLLAFFVVVFTSPAFASSGAPQPPGATASDEPSSAALTLATFALDALGQQPEARIEDAYKWLFQATRGGEHAAPSASAAGEWLAREWATLGPARPDEPLIEPLTPDGAIVRVHLRPYRGSGGTQDTLLRSFLAGAAATTGDASAFTDAWQALRTPLARRAVGYLTQSEWARLNAVMQAQGYPAIHHSDAYEQAYVPAYRVMRREDAERLRAISLAARGSLSPCRRGVDADGQQCRVVGSASAGRSRCLASSRRWLGSRPWPPGCSTSPRMPPVRVRGRAMHPTPDRRRPGMSRRRPATPARPRR